MTGRNAETNFRGATLRQSGFGSRSEILKIAAPIGCDLSCCVPSDTVYRFLILAFMTSFHESARRNVSGLFRSAFGVVAVAASLLGCETAEPSRSLDDAGSAFDAAFAPLADASATTEADAELTTMQSSPASLIRSRVNSPSVSCRS